MECEEIVCGRRVGEEIEGKILRWKGRDRGAPRNGSKPGSKQWKQPRGWRSGNPFIPVVIGRSPFPYEKTAYSSNYKCRPPTGTTHITKSTAPTSSIRFAPLHLPSPMEE